MDMQAFAHLKWLETRQVMKKLITILTAAALLALFAALAESHAEEPKKEPNRVTIKPVTGGQYTTSESLTVAAWKFLEKKKYDKAVETADSCVQKYFRTAQRQQASLSDFAPPEKAFNSWALNDVATCLFIKGRSLFENGRAEEAKAAFQEIIDSYGYAQCWDPRRWFWRVADGARTQLDSIALGVDFGDASSQTLTTRAWEHYKAARYEEAEIFISRCLSLYSSKAREMQASLSAMPPEGRVFDYWALNDVATCLFIRGRILREQGETEGAEKIFQDIMDNYGYAQCWDPKGWFWKLTQGAKNELESMALGVDFGDCSSQTLTEKAWTAFNATDYAHADIYVKKCLEMYSAKALEMQGQMAGYAQEGREFDSWALNDVATCLFIRGKAMRAENKAGDAEKAFQDIINHYGYAQCWDLRGWFWKVAQGAKNELESMALGVDFGDCSSETLTAKAWAALGEGRFKDVAIFVGKCLEMYGDKAKKMQASMTDFAPKGKEFDAWALNDVGTSLFVLGKARYILGENEEAKKVFNEIIEKYSFAQCWDPKGWFWKPAEGAKDQILLMETGIDFGDYTSETLTVKAWKALEQGDYTATILYARKCIELYRPFADKMQRELAGYAPEDRAFDYWALNDVGTCYFILGEAYRNQQDYEKALEAYMALVDGYVYAQCWDPRGWFWKPAVGARGKVSQIKAEQGIDMAGTKPTETEPVF
jgi:tetratricopeptide (TPR) repeat protein